MNHMGRIGCAMLLASATVVAEEKTKQERSDELVSMLKTIRHEYRGLSAACVGAVGCAGVVYNPGNYVSYIPNPPDYGACKEMDLVKREYQKVWKELLRVDRRRVIFDNIPKKIE